MKKLILLFKVSFACFPFLMIFFLCGCEKESEMTLGIAKSKYGGIPFYRSTTELYQYLASVDTLSSDELIAKEEAAQFCSFGRYADEIYNKIFTEDSTIGVDSLSIYVQTYYNYLKLTKESDTNYFFDTKLSTCPFKYAINKDRIMQIGDTIYKFFEQGYIYGSLDCLTQIKSVTERDFENLSVSDTGRFKVYKQTTSRSHIQYYEQAANTPTEKVETIVTLYNLSTNDYYKEYRMMAQTVGKHKVGLVWWKVARDLEESFQVEFYVNSEYHQVSFTFSKNNTKEIVFRVGPYTYLLLEPCTNDLPYTYFQSISGYSMTQYVSQTIQYQN